MRILDPRMPEEKETWKSRGPNIVYRPGDYRDLFWRILPWYSAAFAGVIAAGSIIYGLWLSALFSLFLTALFPPPVRRLLRFDNWLPINERLHSLALSILAIVMLAALCQLEVINRIDDFAQQRDDIISRAEKAFERSDYQAVYGLARRFDMVPDRPLDSIALKARTKQKEEQERLDAFTEVFLDQYRRQRDARRETEAGSDSAGKP